MRCLLSITYRDSLRSIVYWTSFKLHVVENCYSDFAGKTIFCDKKKNHIIEIWDKVKKLGHRTGFLATSENKKIRNTFCHDNYFIRVISNYIRIIYIISHIVANLEKNMNETKYSVLFGELQPKRYLFCVYRIYPAALVIKISDTPNQSLYILHVFFVI